MKIKLTLLLLCFCSSLFSDILVCTTESELEENRNTFYLVKYDGIYVKTEKLKDEYNPDDSDVTPCFIFIDDEDTLLLVTPVWRSSYRFTVIDKKDKIWVSDSMSPHIDFKEDIKEYLKENDFKTHGKFTILEK
ncbi:MAG: hypothetical protein O2827_02365 [Verrucomicrobia bacterium]|nr:hypothetical protein [Verrucomicrobiota bacterium]